MGNALGGGDVGVRCAGRGRDNNVGLEALSSCVGEGDMRDLLEINVGVLPSALVEGEEAVGERGVDGGSGRDFESVRVCVEARMVDAEEGDGLLTAGRRRALLAAVGCIKVELRMNGMVGLLFDGCDGCDWDGRGVDATVAGIAASAIGVTVRLAGALFGGTGGGVVGTGFCGGTGLPTCCDESWAGEEADCLCRDEEKMENGDFLMACVLLVGFVGDERRWGKSARASWSFA